jgi:hypothetical protein
VGSTVGTIDVWPANVLNSDCDPGTSSSSRLRDPDSLTAAGDAFHSNRA